jgi:hypothetical protein
MNPKMYCLGLMAGGLLGDEIISMKSNSMNRYDDCVFASLLALCGTRDDCVGHDSPGFGGRLHAFVSPCVLACTSACYSIVHANHHGSSGLADRTSPPNQ